MPHFYDSLPDSVRALTNQQAIDHFVAGAEVPARAIAGLTTQQLLAIPVPGTWSIQQIVVHLADSDLTAAYRMKRMIAEERPRLDALDESAFAARLGYEEQPIREVCEIFRLNRKLLAPILRRQPESAFERTAEHPEVGTVTLGQILRTYAHHVDHHMAFLKKKRELLGAPL